MKRITRQIIYLILFLLTAIGGGLRLYFREAQLPKEGSLILPELKEPVELLIDNDDLFHLSARNSADLYRALGYLHASQFLPRMDLFLRTANGTLSEVFGKQYLHIDVYTRTLGLAGLTDDFTGKIDSTVWQTLNAYCCGINAFINQNIHHLSRTFKLRGYSPSHWQPADCLAIQRLLAWSLSDQLVRKIVFYKLLEIYGPEKVRDGFPAVTNLPSTGVPMYNTLLFPDLNKMLGCHLDMLNLLGISIADPGHSWVLNASQNTDGRAALGGELPAFMNDYHSLVELNAPGIHVSGFILPGIPAIFCGHNFTIAWNGTIYSADNLEFILTPVLNDRYLHENRWIGFDTRLETIRVRNGNDTTITVKKTRYGPLIAPIVQELTPQQAVSIHWKGFPFSGDLKGLQLLLNADSWDLFKEAVPQQMLPAADWDYLDIRGNIGTTRYVSGLEQAYNISRIPAPSRCYEPVFSGPVDHLFRNFNPKGGYIVHYYSLSAFNNDTSLCINPFTGTRPVSLRNMLTVDPNRHAKVMLPFIKEIVRPADLHHPLPRQALQILTEWHCENDPAGPEAVIFETFLDKLYENIYRDELDLSDPQLYNQFIHLKQELFLNTFYLLQKGTSSWFDNIRTPASVERRKDIVVSAFTETVNSLAERHSPNISQWRLTALIPDDQITKTRFLVTLASAPLIQDYSVRPQRRNRISRESVINVTRRQLLSGNRLQLIREDARVITLRPANQTASVLLQ